VHETTRHHDSKRKRGDRRVLQQQKRSTKRPAKAVAAEEADEVTVLGRTFPMSSGVSNLPPIRKKSSVEKPPTGPDKNDDVATKPGFALRLNVRGESCHIGKFTKAALILPLLNEARKQLRSNGCGKAGADALVASTQDPSLLPSPSLHPSEATWVRC
jgi:hypothetical protein